MKKTKFLGILTLITILGFSLWDFGDDIKGIENDTKKVSSQGQTKVYDNGMKDHLFGENLYLDAKMDSFNDLNDVEEVTDLILIGRKTSQNKPTVIYNTEGRIDIAYTLSDFKVSKVIHGGKLKEGDTFTLLENEAYDEKVDLTYHIAGYNLINLDEEYLLFLNQSETDPYYLISGVNYGKVSLENEKTDFPNALKNTFTAYSNEILSAYNHQEKVRDEAREKYSEFIE